MNSSTRLPPLHCSKLPLCLSIQAALCCLSDALSAAAIDSPQQEASLLLQHVTGLTREALLSSLSTRPTADSLAHASRLLERRLRGEPLQYVLAEAWFYGRRFAVDARVLIPRPETELLVEVARTLSEGMPRLEGTLRLADIGTGSGALALTLAEEIPGCRVAACDASQPALDVARANCGSFPAGKRVQLVRCNLGAPFARVFGGVLANLPYVRSADIPLLSGEVRDHEPVFALDGGCDGLSTIRRLVADAPRLLLPEGWLLLEVGFGQADEVAGLLSSSHCWKDVQAIPDLAGIPRIVRGRRCETAG
ncbi:MAG: peptide chain release factor N(5)-glutamine methyltransferase [Dehalococcoidia bacterium]|jgi:release factor glutamine methyltransferase|nr:peptide chain release factor N(5)-glutamine methyltransferase [Dehalococcoidia bacterium]